MWSQAAPRPVPEDLTRSPVAEPVFALAAPSASVTTGKLRALVINIELPNGTATSRSVISAPYLEGAEWLRLLSRGMMEIQVDFFGTNVVVPVSDCSNASQVSIREAAEQQAKTEIDLDAYRFVSFVLPELGCTFAGLGFVGGRRTWNVGKLLTAGIVVHEWGHNLSLPHLNAMRCSVNNVPIQFASRDLRGQGACVEVEYSGVYSMMGGNDRNGITYRERFQLGWMRPDESRTVNEGTYTLQWDGSPAMLWMQNSEGDLFIAEFVKSPVPIRFSRLYDYFTKSYIDPPYLSGVLVHFVNDYRASTTTGGGYIVASEVLDMNPATSHVLDATLQSGQSFVDATGTIRIDVVATTESSATVNVRGIPFRPNTPQTGFAVNRQPTLGLVDASWVPVVAVSPVTHYELQVSPNSDFRVATTTTFGVTGTSVTMAIPAAAYDTTYYLRVAAANAGGRSEFTTRLEAKWDKPATPPTGVAVNRQATLGLVDVSWVPVAAVSPVTHYELQVSASPDFPVGATTTIGVVGTLVTTAIPSAAFGTNYFLRVAAVNSGGRSEFSAPLGAKWVKPAATKQQTTKKPTKKKPGN